MQPKQQRALHAVRLAVEHWEAVSAAIAESASEADAVTKLAELLGIRYTEAFAVLDMPLRRLLPDQRERVQRMLVDMSPLKVVPLPLDGHGVRAVVSTRGGGVSTGEYASLNLGDHVGDEHDRVVRNRDLLAASLGVARLTIADQQHTANVGVVTAETAGRGHAGAADSRAAFMATDALITNVPGVALTTLVADCAPIVLHDPVHRAVAAIHAGRVGMMSGIVGETVAAMATHFGTWPTDLEAGIGPCIGFDSYEVTSTETEALDRLFPRAGLTRATRPGHGRLDLGRALELQLADLDIHRIHRMPVDTRTNTDTYFSDRAARPCGRFAAVIMLTP